MTKRERLQTTEGNVTSTLKGFAVKTMVKKMVWLTVLTIVIQLFWLPLLLSQTTFSEFVLGAAVMVFNVVSLVVLRATVKVYDAAIAVQAETEKQHKEFLAYFRGDISSEVNERG